MVRRASLLERNPLASEDVAGEDGGITVFIGANPL